MVKSRIIASQDLTTAGFYDLSDQWADSRGITTDYIIPIAMIGTATNDEVLCLQAVGRDFTLPANFGNGSLEVIKGSNPSSSVDIVLERSIDGGTSWTTVGIITVSTGGVVTPSTSGGLVISFSKGNGLRIKAPSVADSTFSNWAFTVIGF